jgi:hypothetical protein
MTARNSNGEIIRNGSYGQRRPTDPSVGNGALPAGFRGAQNRAYVREVQPDELSGNRITGLLDANNPYITNARRRGTEQAGSRGNINSSMAAGAAERSAIEAASPLALQEAGAFGTAAGQNLEYLNQMALEGARDDRAEWDRIAAMEASARAGGDRLQMQREQLAFEGEQRGLDRSHQNYRDYTGYQYSTRRDSHQSRLGQQDYAFRTRTDMRAMPAAFRAQMMQMAMEDPETWTPERVAAFTDFYDQYYGESFSSIDDYFDDYFGGY